MKKHTPPLVNTVAAIIADGGLPIAYQRRPLLLGNEAEFQWLKYHNSKTPQVVMGFNVSDTDHANIIRMMHEADEGITRPKLS